MTKMVSIKRMLRTLLRFGPSILLGLVLVLLVNNLAKSERERVALEQATAANGAAAGLLTKFETELKSNIYLSTGLVAYIASTDHIVREDLNAAMEGVYKAGRHIRNIGLAPDNRLDFVYPLEGNEGVLGLYYPDMPTQWPQVQKAIASKRTVVAGPIPLVQGGIGLVARTPVFLEGGKYWGIISLVIDIKQMAVEVARSPIARDVKFAVRAVNDLGGPPTPVWGDQSLFRDHATPLSMDVAGGRWEIAVLQNIATRDWHEWISVLTVAGNILAGLAAFFLYRFQSIHRQMRANRRTLQTILNTSRAAILVYDDSGTITDANPAAYRLFGVGDGTLTDTAIEAILPGNIGIPMVNGVPYIASDPEAVPVNVRTLGGEVIPVEIKEGQTRLGDAEIRVCTVRDIRERIVYEEKLQSLANMDFMTGVMNRRYFTERAEEAFSQAARYGRPVSLLIFDIDHFKKVNDTYGHPTGDIAIKAAAYIANRLVRTSDFVGRIGGEEFAVILPETNAAQAMVLAERLRFSIERNRMIAEDGTSFQVTISIGIASYPQTGVDTYDMLLSFADKALYRAKDAGRNQVAA